MSETKPIYSGEAVLLNWHDTKSGRKIVLQLEKYAPGAHPFDGLDGERFAVVIVGPLAPAEHAEPVTRKGKAGGEPRGEASTAATGPVIHDDGSSSTTIETFRGIKPKRRWQEMPPSQRAALLVRDPEFWKFAEDYTVPTNKIEDATAADVWLKGELNVKSKAEIRQGHNATYFRFESIEADFRAWRQARGHGVI